MKELDLRQLFVVLLALVSCFISCDKGVEVEIPKNLTPLNPGDRWVYLVGHRGVPDTMTLEIRRHVRVHLAGEDYLAAAYQYYFRDRPTYEWLAWNGPDGYYSLGGISDKDTFYTKKLDFKYPGHIGESWLVPQLYYSRVNEEFYIKDTLTYSLLSTDEEFDTPAGRFKCYVYHFRQKPADDVLAYWNYYYYYYPGLGLVGIIVRSALDGSLKDKAVLYAYKILNN